MAADGTVVTLYVAGNGPNSRAARTNLRAWCDRTGIAEHEVEVVDVVREPDRAVRDGVLLTPQLLVRSAAGVHRVVGNLAGADGALDATLALAP